MREHREGDRRRTGPRCYHEARRLLALYRILDRTAYEHVDQFSEKRKSEYNALRVRVVRAIREIDPSFGTPYHGMNLRPYIKLMKEEWSRI